MTDIKLIPNQKTLEERAAKRQLLIDNKHVADVLFENAVCLTANVSYVNDKSIFDKYWQCVEQYRKEHPNKLYYVINEYCPLALHYCSYFHYFSNGILVHRYNYKKASDYVNKIKRMLDYHGYEIKQVFGPENALQEKAYTDVMISIDNKIKTDYSEKIKFSVREIPSKNEFVKQCFMKNNILLTATNEDFFDVSCREFIAVFSDGHVYISKDYKGSMSFNGDINVKRFMDTHKNTIYLDPIFVPTDYIAALYEKAQSFDWFVSKNTTQDGKQTLSNSEKQKISGFIDRLYTNAHSLCVTNPRAPFNDDVLETSDLTSPEYRRYILFSNGTLVLSDEQYGERAEDSLLLQTLHKCFPKITFNKLFVPDYYIDAILAEMPKRQKKAAEIYIDLLKRKAKKLKKLYNIQTYEALDLVAKLGGWKNWKAIKNLSDQHARHLIAQEQDFAYMARNKSVSWGSSWIMRILDRMNVEYSCSWLNNNDSMS